MSQSKRVTLAGLFLALAIVFQLLGRSFPDLSRWIVGPLINLLLLLTIWYCGGRYGYLLASLTPIMAWLVGQLNPVLAPFIPFIIVGNLLYILPFDLLRNHLPGRIMGMVTGSVLKFFFLSASVRYLLPVLNLGIPPKVQANMATAFGTVQLVAALIGGVIALIVIHMLDKRVRL